MGDARTFEFQTGGARIRASRVDARRARGGSGGGARIWVLRFCARVTAARGRALGGRARTGGARARAARGESRWRTSATDALSRGRRFTMFPIKYPQVWEMYKKAEASFWTGAWRI